MTLPVQWGDMDAFQHVNNTRYFLWFETARIAYLGALEDKPMARLEQQGPILATTRCDFKAPLTYPDTVTVKIGVTRLGGKSFTMSIRVESHARGLAAEGEAVMVWYDYQAARPVPLPDHIRSAIEQIESQRPGD